MRRVPSRELGSYVLEVGGVLILSVLLIAGAADVNKLFQARSAVRAAVQEGARCLYPTDADCAAVSPEVLAAPGRTFDVWVWGSGFQVERETYVASARWRQEPVLEVPVVRDEIVDVTLEQKQFQYRPHAVLYPVTSHTPYFIQTRQLPVVSGGKPLNPRFVDPESGRVVSPLESHSLSSVTGTTTQRAQGTTSGEFQPHLKIGSISFGVGGAWPTAAQDMARLAALPSSVRQGLSCYLGSAVPDAEGPALNWGAPRHHCRYRASKPNSSTVMSSGTPRVPLMLRVTGSTRGTSDTGEGKVTLAMSWTSPSADSGYRELGGRVFKHLTSGDFVTRGLGLSEINESARTDYNDYKDELKAYFELPLVPVDASITLDFFLMSTNRRAVKWTGEKLEVWYPQYRFVHERHNCGYSRSPTSCAAPRDGVPTTHISLTDGVPFQAVVDGVDSCALVEDSGAERDINVVLARLQESAQRGVVPQPHSFRLRVPTDEGLCAPRLSTLLCGYQGEEYLKGCNRDASRDQVARWCQVNSPPGTMLQVKGHTARTTVTGSRRTRACSEPTLPQCAWSHTRQVEMVRYFGESSCDAARTVATAPLTVGPLYVNSCESRVGSIQDMYRREQAIPNDVSISVARLPASPVFSATRPVGACVPHYTAEGTTNEMLCGQGLSALAAEECCRASGGRCRKEQIVRATNSERDQGATAILTAAERRVVEAVQVAYPPARHQMVCSATDPHCLEVSAALLNEETRARVAAKVTVPLNLLHLVDRDLSVVEHETTRELERVVFR